MAIECPACGSPMVLRKGSRGDFYGCKKYPRCTGTRSVINYPSNIELKPGSIHQQAIWDFLINGTEHGCVEAVAGAGKSYSIVNGVVRVRSGIKIGVLSFNNHIIKAMSKSLEEAGITWVKAITYNSLGFRAVMNSFPNLRNTEPMEDKLASIVAEVCNAFPIEWESEDERGAFYSGVVKLCKLAKCYLDDGDDKQSLLEIVERHGIEFYNGDIEMEAMEQRNDYALAAVAPVLRLCLSRQTVWDWDDQVWWTVKMRLPVEKFDMLLIDEAQDTNKMRQELALMACPRGRIIVVGDSKQAIYGFAGSDTESMNNLFTRLNGTSRKCVNFPLPVCRRCPKSHVRLVQPLVPQIEACTLERDGIEAPEGEIYTVSSEKAVEFMKAGDLGQARRNADLIPFAYSLIKQDKKVIVRGRDIGKGLEALIKKLRAKDIKDLMIRLNTYRQKELEKLTAAGCDSDSPKVVALNDKCDCLLFLTEGMDTITDLVNRIRKLFADFDDAGQPKEAIVLGTIHRTKGLEAYNVYIIAPECIPLKTRKDWEHQQERNLAYIAASRAKYLIKNGELVEPGRLYFIGPIPSIYQAHWIQNGQHK